MSMFYEIIILKKLSKNIRLSERYVGGVFSPDHRAINIVHSYLKRPLGNRNYFVQRENVKTVLTWGMVPPWSQCLRVATRL